MHSYAKRSLLLIAALMLSACVYRMDIQQGNYIDVDRLVQVEVGMDERQVSYLLGDPVAKDSFDATRWTYVYYLHRGDEPQSDRFLRQVIVHFNAEGVVTQIDGAEYAHELAAAEDDYAEEAISEERDRVIRANPGDNN